MIYEIKTDEDAWQTAPTFMSLPRNIIELGPVKLSGRTVVMCKIPYRLERRLRKDGQRFYLARKVRA